jgi:hypothetical protein
MCWELPPTNVTASGVRGVEDIVDGCEHHWDQVRRAPGVTVASRPTRAAANLRRASSSSISLLCWQRGADDLKGAGQRLAQAASDGEADESENTGPDGGAGGKQALQRVSARYRAQGPPWKPVPTHVSVSPPRQPEVTSPTGCRFLHSQVPLPMRGTQVPVAVRLDIRCSISASVSASTGASLRSIVSCMSATAANSAEAPPETCSASSRSRQSS